MGWFKIYYPLVLYVRYLLSEKKKKKPAPPATGKNATPQEKGKSKDMEEKRKQAEKQQKSEDGLKLVVTGAKIKCPLCTNPIGTLLVTDLNPTVQNKPVATVSDNKKTNLLFTGTCTKSPNSSVPCIAIIQPGQWQNTGSLKVQNKSPLLAKSSVKCMYGSADIKFINSGQMKPPFSYDDKGPERKTKPEETINIRVSVFFDGTGNNKTNTESRLAYRGINFTTEDDKTPDARELKAKAAEYKKNNLDKKGKIKDEESSYENDFTNVARLYKDHKEDKKNTKDKSCHVYVEGIGTTNNDTDSNFGLGIGMGDTGILDKVKAGCKDSAQKIKKLAEGKTIITLTIDAFGFSRGAAAARNFLHEITLDEVKPQKMGSAGYGTISVESPGCPAGGELGRLLNGVKYTMLDISFAGIFDTVPSYGIIKSWNASTLHLDAVKKARTVLHLTAMDERRANFSLVTAKSKGLSCEKALPGVHSDVGGSYNAVVNDEKHILFAGNYLFLDREKQYLLEGGWFTADYQLTKHYSPKTYHMDILGGYLEGSRLNISNAYSFVSLYIMRDTAAQKKVYLKFKGIMDNDFIIPADLDYVNKRLRGYVFNSEKPMKFFTRGELDQQIDKLRSLEKAAELPRTLTLQKSSTYMAPAVQIVDERPAELNPDDFNDHPDLKQMIKDHYALRTLRSKYLHISHKCGVVPTFTLGVFKYYDPYSQSIHDAKIRGQYEG